MIDAVQTYVARYADLAAKFSTGFVQEMLQKALAASTPAQSTGKYFRAENGFVFWNPDTGEEYLPLDTHPVRSGQVPDAERIRYATAMEKALWDALQEETKK